MRTKFIGYYDPTVAEIDEAWNNGFFAFDANTLLNLYRYTDRTRNDFLIALQKIKDKLFLPYQSAYEYHNNRLNVINNIENAYKDLYNLFFENYDKNLKNQIKQFQKHPSIIVENISKLYNNFLDKIDKELDKQKSKHPDFKTEDKILDELSELFDSLVGESFSEDELLKIYKEGENRYSKEIPPGYKDVKLKIKESERNIYGDLIIWKELLNFTKNKKQPLVFITDDRKEDWWKIHKGKTIRPREELIKEFYDYTGVRILIYNADNFLSFAKKRGLLPEIKNETIEEVKNIRVADENIYKRFNDLIGNSISDNYYKDSRLAGNFSYQDFGLDRKLNLENTNHYLSTIGLENIYHPLNNRGLENINASEIENLFNSRSDFFELRNRYDLNSYKSAKQDIGLEDINKELDNNKEEKKKDGKIE